MSLNFDLLEEIFEFTHWNTWFNFSICSSEFNLIFKKSSKLKIIERIKEANPDMSQRECYEHCINRYLFDDEILEVSFGESKIMTLASTLSYIEVPLVDIDKLVKKEIFKIILEYLEIYKFKANFISPKRKYEDGTLELWEEEFFKGKEELEFEMLVSCSQVMCKCLANALCFRIGTWMKDKTQEELNQKLMIVGVGEIFD